MRRLSRPPFSRSGCLGWLIGAAIVVALAVNAISGSEGGGGSHDSNAPATTRSREQQTGPTTVAGPERRGGGERRDREVADRGGRVPSVPGEARRTFVTDVVDGDTVDLAALGSSRLIGVDTPEVYYGAECFGAEASAFTASRLPIGAPVYYVHGSERTDSYGRDLVYLWLRGGTFFNAELLKAGYAVTLTIPPNLDYVGLFRRLAVAARRDGRGLWAKSTCGGHANAPVHGGSPGGAGCEPGYHPCVPSYPPDVDCADLDGPITVSGSDPHHLDADGDGVACE